MKKFILFLVGTLFIQLSLFSQDEANNWYFGENAGVSFSTGDPVALTDGALDTWEGCSSISASNGSLRFYTDGIYVYNRDHALMPNGSGLLGDPSSTQSGIIVPDPGNNQKYYIFSIDDVDLSGGTNGLNYSVVDMTLEGFKGDVVSGQKNILLTAPLCEKVTAVGHSNGFDTWVITQKWGTNDFYVYLISASGVNTTPIISTVGEIIGGGDVDVAKGYLKVSPDGTKIAKANAGLKSVEIFDFNNTTGVVSNQIIDNSLGGEPYGIEFSPNNQFLYVNTWKSVPGQYLYQYDLKASDPIGTRYTVATGTEGALQLAPDNRIYVARAGTQYLSRINQPNKPGASCVYEFNAVFLDGKNCMWGLPPFVQSFFSFNAGFYNEPPCFGTATQFYENSSQEPDSVLWNFGNSSSGDENTSTELNPTHLFTSEGIFNVKLTVWIEEHEDIASKFISVTLPPQVDLGEDTFFCEGDTYIIDAGEGYAEYVWSTGETTQTIGVQTAGEYWVSVKNSAGCWAADTLNLNAYEKPTISLGDDLEFCEGELTELDAGEGYESYFWSTGDETQTLVVQSTGNYWVEVTNSLGCPNRDTIYVLFNEKPVADAGPTQSIDQGQTTTLEGSASGGSGSYTYSWEPADMLEQSNVPNPITLPVINPTIFKLVVTDGKGCVSSTDQVLININGSTLAAFPVAEPDLICQGDMTEINANASGGGGEYTYEWTSDPSGFTSSNHSFTDYPDETTTYKLKVYDQFGNSFENEVKVNVIPLEVINLVPDNINPFGQDTIKVCVRDSVLLDAGHDGDPSTTTYHWVQANSLSRFNKVVTNGNWFDVQTHEVRVNYGGETDCETTGIITIIFDLGICKLGLDETELDNKAIDLYPNPNKGTFTLKMNREIVDLEVKVFDLNGREVLAETITGRYPPGYQQQIAVKMEKKGMPIPIGRMRFMKMHLAWITI